MGGNGAKSQWRQEPSHLRLAFTPRCAAEQSKSGNISLLPLNYCIVILEWYRIREQKALTVEQYPKPNGGPRGEPR